jgi:hypothetical protein
MKQRMKISTNEMSSGDRKKEEGKGTKDGNDNWQWLMQMQ